MADDHATKVTKALLDEGKIIEAGWMGYRMLVVPAGASAVQVEETRRAFFAGAQHLFGSIMTGLEPGTEETEADLSRFDKISKELNEYAETLAKALSKGRG